MEVSKKRSLEIREEGQVSVSSRENRAEAQPLKISKSPHFTFSMPLMGRTEKNSLLLINEQSLFSAALTDPGLSNRSGLVTAPTSH